MTARAISITLRHALLAIAVLLGAFVAGADRAEAREWLKAELQGIVIYSDGYPQELQRWALKVRLIDALLRTRFGRADTGEDPGSPLTIYLLEEGSDIERLTGRKNLHGLYSPSIEGSFLIASRAPGYQKSQLSGQMALFHEYAHHFMYRHFAGAYPAWYREGIAEYAGAVHFDADWNAATGLPNWPRMRHLDGKPMPLRTILDSSVEDFSSGEKARFYAWSWKLVHLLSANAEDTRRLNRYLSLFAAGMDSQAAAAASFGDLETLEARLAAHSVDVRSGRVVPAGLSDAPPVSVAVLDPVAARLVDLRLTRLAGNNRDAALASLRTFVAANPGNAEARRELALAEADQESPGKDSRLAAALGQADAALALDPTDIRTIAIRAGIAFRALKADPSATPADWDAARAPLIRATGPETHDPMALATLFGSYLSEPRQPPRAALDAMDRAFALQPESYEIRTLETYALAMRGRFDDARRAARTMASDPHSGPVGQRALDSINRLESSVSQP